VFAMTAVWIVSILLAFWVGYRIGRFEESM
jgi:hypothetical protein